MVDTPDVLLLLRACVASSLPIYLSPTDSLDTATELSFPPVPSLTSAPIAIPLSTLTRFIKDANAVDLRSVYFAWKQRDTPITEYIASAQALGVTHLGFIERLELVTYLEGGQEESDHIRPLRSGGAGGSAPGGAAGDFGDGDGSIGQDGSVVGGGIGSNGALGAKMSSFGGAGSGSLLVGKVRQTDPRLLEIYSYERVVTNRNIMLRGNKPTDFTHVRKHAEDFISRLRTNGQKPPTGGLTSSMSSTHPARPSPHPHHVTRASVPSVSGSGSSSSSASGSSKSRRQDPIILLSPSASSLLTMSNIKSFLEEGVFTPPQLAASNAPNFLRVSRLLPAINASTPIRFDVVDSADKFKPDYWDKVVAVFTTGQEWQFRTYRWSEPVELFRKVRGFYVGWEGERVPDPVLRWGTGVSVFTVDRGRRFRDREVCEKFWEGVERWMRVKGWGR